MLVWSRTRVPELPLWAKLLAAQEERKFGFARGVRKSLVPEYPLHGAWQDLSRSCLEGIIAYEKGPDELKSFGTESDDACPEALVELSRLECLPQYHKRRNTILSLVTAHLAGVSEETVWQKEATCSRNTWHTKWKHDRLTMEVLANVERLTREFQDGATLRALRLAAEMLAMASPAAAQQLIEVSAHGRMRSLMDDKTVYERVGAADAVRASLGVLDRAGVETAPKQPMQVGLTPELQAMIEKVYGSDDGG